MKRYKCLMREQEITFSDEEINILIQWFIGSLQKKNQNNTAINIFKKIQNLYPIEGDKILYRSIRLPFTDNLKEGDKIITEVSKPNILISSWTDTFKTALDIFNNSKFYDELEGYNSVILSSKIESHNILTNYKIIKNIIVENKLDKLKNIFNKWIKEKEYIIYNQHKFNCHIKYIK